MKIVLEKTEDQENVYRAKIVDNAGNPCSLTVYSVIYEEDRVIVAVEAKCGDKEAEKRLVTIEIV